MLKRSPFLPFFALLALWIALSVTVAAERPAMVEFQWAGQTMQGLQLINVPERTVVLGQDGWLHDTVDKTKPENLRRIDAGFTPASVAEVRGQLLSEFGRDYEVVATTHYLVVQPRGRGQRWPKHFEELYRQFIRHMELRGIQIRSGRFPLVAVVLPDRQAMQDQFQKLGIQISNVAGVYHLASNRVMMHENGYAEYIAETIRHETAHQAAYNTGVHSRVSVTPQWLVEGIGSLFEPAKMGASRENRSTRDRVHANYARQFQKRYQDSESLLQAIRQLVSDDTAFKDPDQIADAYCLSWAMVFYLSEARPESFRAAVQQTSTGPPFRVYPRSHRIRDFQAWVGGDIERFTIDLQRYVRAL
ncbi:hypothetical protein FF011L_52260 [Roseimaritima multifibrata]|uniref:DUF1570 domain-containing protein n=1 Tax=Roseimaritima multifibrata TaxID=1930274 RepID=A0A517MNF4_9BACT|nr:DUF1570 domain-containing protein [Roseimaritima multifibrata]QDS96416.1 hypothetical protein FF011L_52260 [Roseimaritima multifibrata]